MNPTRFLSRRMFLRGLGGTTLAIPFLPSLSPSAGAATTGPPQRFIALKSYNGQIADQLYPTWQGGPWRTHAEVHKDEKNWSGFQKVKDVTTYVPPNMPGTAYGMLPLTGFVQKEGKISEVLGPWLNRFAPKMNVLRGLDSLAEINHNDGFMLGNFNSCLSAHGRTLEPWATIDQVMAYSKSFYPQQPTLRSLHLVPVNTHPTFSDSTARGHNTMSFTHHGKRGGVVEPVNPFVDPKKAFDSVFGSVSSQDTARQGRDLKFVDAVLADYTRAKNHYRISTEDKQRLEQHMTHLSELQGRLGAGAKACQPGGAPTSRTDTEDLEPATIEQVYADMIDIMVAAIQCDLTRVVTLDMVKAVVKAASGTYGSRQVGVNPGSWHNDAHTVSDPAPSARILALNQWLSEHVFAKLLEKLDVPEADGRTYLDNALVFWGNEMSGGQLHYNYSMPCVLAGGAGGRLKTDQYVDYIDWTHDASFYFWAEHYVLIRGVPYNRLLVTLLQTMGITPEEYERPGQKGYGSYSRAGIDHVTHKLTYDESKFGSVLPGLMV